MLATLLLLQVSPSLLVRPMYLDAEPPEARSVRGILVLHEEAPGAPQSLRRTPDEARALAEQIHSELVVGGDFGKLARQYSSHPSARNEGNLGTVWPGMFPDPIIDGFLFSAELGQLSEPIESPIGFHIVQRIERDAAWLQIVVDGIDDAARVRCAKLLERLAAGEDFGELAKADSDDPLSAPRGGAVGIFQRHARDASIRKQAFAMSVGETRGPVETSSALYILRRVPVDSVDPALVEDTTARATGIVVSFTGAIGADPLLERTPAAAGEFAIELVERIQAGEDMAQVAAEFNDDPGGRERRGDLGWIRRGTSDTPQLLDKIFLEPRGKLLGPIRSSAGWVILRREL